MKLKLLAVLAVAASSFAVQVLGQPVSIGATSPPPAYPAAGEAACSRNGGTFSVEAEARECVVASGGARTIYIAMGSDEIEWVQTVKYSVPMPDDTAQLGPASAGCARPEGAVGLDWALSCM